MWSIELLPVDSFETKRNIPKATNIVPDLLFHFQKCGHSG